MNLFLNRTVEKYPVIKYIIPYAGWAFPPLVQQFANIPQMIGHPESVDEAFVRIACRHSSGGIWRLLWINEYELQVALKYACAEWLKPRLRIYIMDPVCLLSAAILVDNKEIIKAHASDLILDYSDSYSVLSGVDYVKNVLTPGVIGR
jgi:hypothetical protein